MKNKAISIFKLPAIKDRMPKARRISMDNYLRFVIFNLKYTVDIDTCRRDKRITAIDIPFKL